MNRKRRQGPAGPPPTRVNPKSDKRFTLDEAAVIEAFKTTVCQRQDTIDPDDSHDWFALSYGFFLGRGIEPERAHEIALHVRYELQYWSGA